MSSLKQQVNEISRTMPMDDNVNNHMHSSQVIELLNRSLRMEYSMIVHYPLIANFIKDEKIRELAIELGSGSIKHANTVADLVKSCGGEPVWSVEPFPEKLGIKQIFSEQLEKEKQAMEMHKKNACLVDDEEMKNKLEELAREENNHIKTVNKILSMLG